MPASERAEQARAELQLTNAVRASRAGFIIIDGEVLGCIRSLAQVSTTSQRFVVFDLRTGEGTVLEFTVAVAAPVTFVGIQEYVMRRTLAWLRRTERVAPTSVWHEGDLPTEGSVLALTLLQQLRQHAAQYGRLPELDYVAAS